MARVYLMRGCVHLSSIFMRFAVHGVRAATNAWTTLIPVLRRAQAAALMVAPVVHTSSTSNTGPWGTIRGMGWNKSPGRSRWERDRPV